MWASGSGAGDAGGGNAGGGNGGNAGGGNGGNAGGAGSATPRTSPTAAAVGGSGPSATADVAGDAGWEVAGLVAATGSVPVSLAAGAHGAAAAVSVGVSDATPPAGCFDVAKDMRRPCLGMGRWPYTHAGHIAWHGLSAQTCTRTAGWQPSTNAQPVVPALRVVGIVGSNSQRTRKSLPAGSLSTNSSVRRANDGAPGMAMAGGDRNQGRN